MTMNMTMDCNIVVFATNNVKPNHTTFKANCSRVAGEEEEEGIAIFGLRWEH
jgi:hypothetical protein